MDYESPALPIELRARGVANEGPIPVVRWHVNGVDGVLAGISGDRIGAQTILVEGLILRQDRTIIPSPIRYSSGYLGTHMSTSSHEVPAGSRGSTSVLTTPQCYTRSGGTATAPVPAATGESPPGISRACRAVRFGPDPTRSGCRGPPSAGRRPPLPPPSCGSNGRVSAWSPLRRFLRNAGPSATGVQGRR